MTRKVEAVTETPLALPAARPFDVKIHWTADDQPKTQVTVQKVMAGDWVRAIDLAMRAVRSDKTVPLDAKVIRIVP